MLPDLHIETICQSRLSARPEYESAALWERLSRPAQFTRFAVVWVDDGARVRVNQGYYAAFGDLCARAAGLIFQRGLAADEVKALAFYALLEESLCRPGSAAGALCGADLDPAPLSGGESMRFCQSFVKSLYRCAPASMALAPLSDNISDRELGYLAGQQQALQGPWNSVSVLNPAASPRAGAMAAGYGLCYFAQAALHRAAGERLDGKTVAIHGAGAMAAFAGAKAAQLGGRVIAAGDDKKDILCLSADVYLLCCRADPLDGPDAEQLLARRPDGVFEGVAMACTPSGAARLGQAGTLFAPAIAAGAGAAVAGPPDPLPAWAWEKRLRTAMDKLLQTAWDAGDGDLFQGAYAAAVENAAGALLRRGVV